MAFYKYKGKRIRASDKNLVYRFCAGTLLLLFVAVLLLLNMGQSSVYNPHPFFWRQFFKFICVQFKILL